MNRAFRYLLLNLTLVLIVTAIVYLEGLKAPAGEVATNSDPTQYHDFVNPSAFVNTAPFQLADEIGKKVILIDFWTYSCINCQRTIPYLSAWWDKYKDKGLLIVGMHTPEFEFEKELANVENAIQQFGVNYPVVLDNDRGTWNAYGNRYWPHEYLIDLSGKIVYDHIGEGGYEESEAAIQKALGLTDMEMATPENSIAIDYEKIGSPETYLGSERASNSSFVSTEPLSLESNQAYLVGDWTQEDEYSETTSEKASLLFEYNSKNVYIVASSEPATEVEVWVDGTLVKTLTVQANTLYPVVEGADYGVHTLKLVPKGKGFKLFTFTFG